MDINPKLDVYAVGCMLYSYQAKSSAFPGKNFDEIYKNNESGLIDLSKVCNDSEHTIAYKFQCKMLEKRVENRFYASEQLLDQFIVGDYIPRDSHKNFNEDKCWYSLSKSYKQFKSEKSCESLEDESNRMDKISAYINNEIFGNEGSYPNASSSRENVSSLGEGTDKGEHIKKLQGKDRPISHYKISPSRKNASDKKENEIKAQLLYESLSSFTEFNGSNYGALIKDKSVSVRHNNQTPMAETSIKNIMSLGGPLLKYKVNEYGSNDESKPFSFSSMEKIQNHSSELNKPEECELRKWPLTTMFKRGCSNKHIDIKKTDVSIFLAKQYWISDKIISKKSSQKIDLPERGSTITDNYSRKESVKFEVTEEEEVSFKSLKFPNLSDLKNDHKETEQKKTFPVNNPNKIVVFQSNSEQIAEKIIERNNSGVNNVNMKYQPPIPEKDDWLHSMSVGDNQLEKDSLFQESNEMNFDVKNGTDANDNEPINYDNEPINNSIREVSIENTAKFNSDSNIDFLNNSQDVSSNSQLGIIMENKSGGLNYGKVMFDMKKNKGKINKEITDWKELEVIGQVLTEDSGISKNNIDEMARNGGFIKGGNKGCYSKGVNFGNM